MCSSVSFQVKGVVEAFTTERTEVAFYFHVGFQMSLQKFGEFKGLPTYLAAELRVLVAPEG